MDKLYIVMPAYNEDDVIVNVVDEWHKVIEKIGHDSKLVIFNDGSKDNTLSVLENIRSKYPNLAVISKEKTGHRKAMSSVN
jgi:glycosyltransferase involved in cell wall biosynthesis